MKLSTNFSLEEMTFSETALRRGYHNDPNAAQVENLKRLCVELLEPIRALLGVPVHVNSGYRAPALNTLIGGAVDSAHMDGRAADLVPIGMSLTEAFARIHSASLGFDTLIFECASWLHVSIAPPGAVPRRDVLTATGHPGAWHYQRVV